MVAQRDDLACCVRCAGAATADRLARRSLLKAGVHPPAAGPSPGFPGRRPDGGAAGFPGRRADGGAAQQEQPAAPPAVLAGTVLAGTVLDTSPQVITLYCGGGETRLALTPETSVWKGRRADPTAVEAGDSVVIRLLPRPRGVADRIWANAGRVTGVIVERDPDGVLVDEGRTTSRQAVVIPGRAASRLQVRFPRLEPGYLIDVIGLRTRGYLEALIPATSQPGMTGKKESTSASTAPAWKPRSAGLSAAALMRIRTWSANIFGSGTSTTSRTSGPPKLW